MNEHHECVKDESFREMTGEFKVLTEKVGGLCTDIALVKRDVSDLKQVTVTMSDCIKALTESSIKAGENNITRDQFYGKIDELVTTRQQMIDGIRGELTTHKAAVENRFDEGEKRLTAAEEVLKDYISIKKLIAGIGSALVIMILIELYRLLVMH